MKKTGKLFVSGIAFFAIPTFIMAQSSVGIGINVPNPRSVLHLEATSGNQGLLLPKLTTAQMQANPFLQSLGLAEKGLMVYDTDRNQMFTWDGAQWKSSSNFSLPYVDSVENGPNQTNLIRLINKGNSGNAVGILYLENRDPNNSFAPLLITTNSKVQGAADFIITNQENTNDGIGVTYRGLGSAGAFLVNNTASTVAALKASTNGVAGSVAIRGEATNNGTGIAGFSNGNAFLSPALYAEQSGTGDAAGVFKLSNASNNYSAVYGESLGAGPTFFSLQKGTGRAGQFQISNPTNAEAALRGFTDGLGRAGFFTISNTANNADAIYTTTNAPGGTAMGAGNSGNGNAIAIWDGGLKLSTGTLNGGGNISVRKAAYEITGGSAYTLSFPLSDGETFFFYNNTPNPVTVNSISIAANTGNTFIVMSNELRSM